MSYIKKEKRNSWLKVIQGKVDMKFHITSSGDLNYVITQACLAFLDFWKERNQEENCYEHFNAVIGALECAKQELYRRVVIPYENKKKKENGDVF